MKVLVTGAKGMLGQDLCPILEDAGCFVIETDVESLDITDADAVNTIIAGVKPDLVIHAAAYTNVDLAQKEPEKAFLINETGTRNIAKASQDVDATLIYISTDYVFSGEKAGKYLPNDPTGPINVYGESKLAGEKAVQEVCKKYYIARTSWLYGEHGKNFVDTMISLAEKPELKVVDDQVGCPTWTVELAYGILKILNMPFGIYHLCGSNSTSWYGFAREIFRERNLNVNLIPCTTDEFPREARRPKSSAMDNGGLLRDWKIALREYLNIS